MARTRTIAEALTVAKVARQGEDDLAAYIANKAIEMIWNAYDWRESLAYLPPFFLIPGEQDYGFPFYALPYDFRGLREAYVLQTTANPPLRIDLKVIRDIRPTGAMGLPRDIGYEYATQIGSAPGIPKLRLFPRVPNNIGATEWLVDGTYKMRSPAYTPSTLTSLIPWDDEYFGVMVDALKWASAEYLDSPSMEKRYAVMINQVDRMAAKEGLDLGDPSIAPSEPLAVLGFGYLPYLTI